MPGRGGKRERDGTDVGYRIERTRDCKLLGGSSTSRREPVRFIAINSYPIRSEIHVFSNSVRYIQVLDLATKILR